MSAEFKGKTREEKTAIIIKLLEEYGIIEPEEPATQEQENGGRQV
jgi:hypothetical protein